MTFAESLSELSVEQKTTLRALPSDHLSDRIGFNIPLKLRNQPELEARICRGEVIAGNEMYDRYLPWPADYEMVAAWLRSEGFTVDEFGGAPLAVFAHGTVAQLQQSFSMEMALVSINGKDRVVARTAPSMPSTVAGPALGVSGLSYRRPKPRLVPHVGPTPAAVPSGGYHIADIRTAYSGAALTVNGTTLDGSGQTIGIEAYLFPSSSDLSAFWLANGITRKGTITNLDINNASLQTQSGDPGDYGETALDVEWASGIAPGANIVVYATNETSVNGGNDDAERIYAKALADAMVTGSTLHVFSSSYGPTESALSTTEKNAYNNYFMSMTAAGLTYLNASGDIGSGNGSTLTPEAYGDCPYATGVGGTNLQVNTSTDARTSEVVWGRTAGTTTDGSSGGLSKFFAKPGWQVGTGTPTGTFRGIPDIALAADYENSPAYYYHDGGPDEVGGTSWSSPTFAGFLAMIEQGRALNVPARGPLGFINPRIYPLIGTNNFYDVISGNNGAYTATSGYDLCTGVGVPTVSNLLATLLGPNISNLSPGSGAAGTSVTITGTNFYSGPTSALTVTFNGVAASSFTVNSATSITAVAPSGVTTGPIVVTSFGDPATSSNNFTVLNPDLTVASTHSGTFTQGDAGDTYTLTVTNGGTAATSGTVTLTDTLPSGLSATAMSGSGWTCNVSTLTATYAGSVTAGSAFPPITLTVNVALNATSGTNNVAVSGGGETNTTNNTGGDATTIVAQTPTQSWRYQYFGTNANTGNAADTANPAGDGIPNLLKYALGLNPTHAETTPVVVDSATGYLRLTAPRNQSATDVTYTVQVTADPTTASSWTSSGVTLTSSSTQVQGTDTTPIGSVPKHFIRLEISR